MDLNDLLNDVTFLLLTNQRPRKCDRTERQKDRKTEGQTSQHYDDLCPPGGGRKNYAGKTKKKRLLLLRHPEFLSCFTLISLLFQKIGDQKIANDLSNET